MRFDDAIAVLRDPLAKLFDDPDHSSVALRGAAGLKPAGRHDVKAERIRQGEPLIAEAPKPRGGGLHLFSARSEPVCRARPRRRGASD